MSAKIELEQGQKFGKLTVVKESDNHKWELKCDCGSTEPVFVDPYRLTRGIKTHCGCETPDKKKLKVGDQFGKLILVSWDKDKESWQCVCECTAVIQTKSASLINGKRVACGKLGKCDNEVDSGKLSENIELIEFDQETKVWTCLCKKCDTQFKTTAQALKRQASCGCANKQRKIIEPGTSFGKLKVLEWNMERHKYKCECQCERKNIVFVSSNYLLSNRNKSCGCLDQESRKEIEKNIKPNDRFGRLVVLEYIKDKTKWLCKCDCGKEKLVSAGHLNANSTISCKCFGEEVRRKARFDQRLPDNQALKRKLFRSAIDSAEKRGYVFNLNIEEFLKIIIKNCYYCGEPPSKRTNGDFAYNGIDRINNLIGYEPTNICACCPDCNYAKRMMSIDEFFSFISKVYKYSIQNKKEKPS